GEGAVREVPQRALAPDRLVHHCPGAALRLHPRDGGVVAGQRVAADEDQLAPAQPLRVRAAQRLYPFARGQMWPSGSTGPPQKGQAGRPARTTVSQRRAKARACAGPSVTRSVLTTSSSSVSSGSRSWASMTSTCRSSSHESARALTRKSSSIGVSRGALSAASAAAATVASAPAT